jgi:hypothetical protein
LNHAENLRLKSDNDLLHAELNKLRNGIDAKAKSGTPALDSKIKGSKEIKSPEQKRHKQPATQIFVPSRIDLAMLQDYTIEQERIAIIADLMTLASKAQRYYTAPVTLDGGGKSFLGLTADSSGLARLASGSFTNNANGKYTIKTAGNIYRIILHGVGKIPLADGTFPTYDMVVTSATQVPTRLN